ncbi:hypothetical protein HDV05_003135 [Chytridiales sp. JEL 0842]|nr:hypothetical protein HDV05_003135 [Chytridiales sp. JEL 0842]
MACKTILSAEVAASFINDLKVAISKAEEAPLLVGFLANDDPAAKKYAEWTKKTCEECGIRFEARECARQDLEDQLFEANKDKKVNGIMIYYPVFGGPQDAYLQNSVSVKKDVEGLCHTYRYNMYHNVRYLDEQEKFKCIIPCTPLAVIKILEYISVYNSILPYGNRLHGRTITVINRSEVVGRPLAALLANDGAKVYSVDEFGIVEFHRGAGLHLRKHEVFETTMTLKDVLPVSDVVVTGVPSPNYKVDTQLLKEGVVAINFSTAKNFNEDIKQRASIYVPAVGKVTVAMLLRNVLRLQDLRISNNYDRCVNLRPGKLHLLGTEEQLNQFSPAFTDNPSPIKDPAKSVMSQSINFPRAVHDAYERIFQDSDPNNWALFGYDRGTNDLKVLGTGDGGLEELQEEWEDSKILYAFCRVIEPISKLPKFVFISWCGEGVPVAKKGYIQGFHVHVNARGEYDITPDAIMKKVKDASGAKYGIHNEKPNSSFSNTVAPVGSVYEPVKTNPKPMMSTPAPTQHKPATSNYVPTIVKASTTPTSSAFPKPSPARANFPPVSASSPTYNKPSSPVSSSPAFTSTSELTFEPDLGAPKVSASSMDARVLAERERRQREEREIMERERREAQEREERERMRKVDEERKRREREEEEMRRREDEERRRKEEEEREREREERERRESSERVALLSAPKDAAQATPLSLRPASSVGGLQGICAVVLYDYTPLEDNEIQLEESEIITHIEKLDEGWWQGVNSKAQIGLFPANYVQEIEGGADAGKPVEAPPAQSYLETVHEPAVEEVPMQVQNGDAGKVAIALYDYDAAEPNEISFRTGDKISHIEFVSDDWWQGRVNGVDGLFPGNYVEIQE